jgi:hypothetical protein
MIEDWADFYAHNNPGYDILVSSPMIIELVNKIVPMGQTFIEWGYGTGYTAIALANLKKHVTAYDPAIGLIENAMKARTERLISLGGHVAFTCDKQILKPADIVYSQGLLEHFTDEGIIEIITEQLQYAKVAVVFSVPSENYPQQDRGDERLLSIAEWESILEPFKKQLAQLYYYERRQHLIGVIRK